PAESLSAWRRSSTGSGGRRSAATVPQLNSAARNAATLRRTVRMPQGCRLGRMDRTPSSGNALFRTGQTLRITIALICLVVLARVAIDPACPGSATLRPTGLALSRTGGKALLG